MTVLEVQKHEHYSEATFYVILFLFCAETKSVVTMLWMEIAWK